MKYLAAWALLLTLSAPASAEPSAEVAPPDPAPEGATPSRPRPSYVGRAAPATEAATTTQSAPIRAGIEVFASYAFQRLTPSQSTPTWFHVFDVPRVHAAIDAERGDVRGRLLIEAVRSASDGALLGVAGDSLVLRVREAYAEYLPIRALALSIGMMPTSTVPEIDGTWRMRAIAASAIETAGLASPSDVGARLRWELPHRLGFVAASAYNGEGYTNRELNRGKNVEAAVSLHPPRASSLAPLGLFGSYVSGSMGTASALANRATAGIVWQGELVRAGGFATYAWGVRDAAEPRAMVVSAFARVEPVDRWLLGARLDHAVRDVGASNRDAVTTVFGAAGYRVADPLETYLAVSRSLPTSRAEAELVSANSLELRAIARFVY